MLLRDVDKKDGSLGKWLGVGGKLEKGENADQCFLREVLEETGILLSKEQIQRRGIVDFMSDSYESERMFLYTAKITEAMPEFTCNEGTLAFHKKTDILSLRLWEGDHVFLEELLNDRGFFTLSLIYVGESGEELSEVIKGKLVLSDVENLDTEELSFYTQNDENQLKHIFEPKEGLFIAETPVVIERAIKKGFTPYSFLCEHKLLFDVAAYKDFHVPLYSGPQEMLTRLTGYNLTHGMLCAMYRTPVMSAQKLLSDSSIRRVALLENVMNPTNVGAIVRSAAALNIQAMLLTHGCSDPLYRRAIRVSMGNIFELPYAYLNLGELKDLKKQGYQLVSMALSPDAISLDDEKISEIKKEKLIICLGTESTGLSKELLSLSDYVIKIPMSGDVDSLNVAAASAVAFWELRQSLNTVVTQQGKNSRKNCNNQRN